MKKLNDPKLLTFKNLVISLLIVTGGGRLMINYWKDTPQKNIHEFEATIDSNPRFSGKYNCYTFNILESKYTILTIEKGYRVRSEKIWRLNY